MNTLQTPEPETSGTDTDASIPVTAADLDAPDRPLRPTAHVGLTDTDAATRIRDLERRAERHRRVAEDCCDRLATLEARVAELEAAVEGDS